MTSPKSLLGHLYWSSRVRWIEWRFGNSSPRFEKTRMAHLGARDHTPVTYYAIRRAMRTVTVQPDDVLVDVGCGSGRILNWWLHCGYRNRMVGIELDPEIAAATQRRLARRGNVDILTGDAVDLTPPEASVCVLYNPFDHRVLQRWHDTVLARSVAPELRVLYVNAVHREIFEKTNQWSLQLFPRESQIAAEPDVLLAIRRRGSSAHSEMPLGQTSRSRVS